MEKRKIILDSDGVLADLLPYWAKVYNEAYGDNLSPDVLGAVYGDMHNVVKPECGEKIYDFLGMPGFFEALKPMDGAVEGANKLLEDPRLEVFIATHFSSDAEAARGKMRWFSQYLPKFVDKEVIFLCGNKHLITSDVLVDDAESNLRKWSENMMGLGKDDIFAIAMAAPHNEELAYDTVIDRVKDWPELLDFIHGFVL